MMVMSMTAPAFAKNLEIPKVLHTDGNTYAPEVEFTLNLKNVTGKHTFEGKEYEATGTAPAGLLTTIGAKFAPVAGELGEDDPRGRAYGAQFKSKFTLTVDESKITKEGIYFYEMEENEPNYEGIRKSAAKFLVMVVAYKDQAGNFQANIAVEREGDPARASQNPKFATVKPTSIDNNYGKHFPTPDPNFPDPDPDPTPGPNDDPDPKNDTTHDVTFKKKVAGFMTDESKKFSFTVKVDSQNGKEFFKVTKVDGSNNDAETVVEPIQKNGEQVYEFKHNDGIRIYGLTKSDVVTVVEAGGHEYTMTVEAVSKPQESYFNALTHNGFTTTAKVIKDKAKVDIINTKQAPTPTGIVMNVAPYAMMLAVAGGLGVVFMNRKKEEE
jgi:sortase B signal domain, QVPTGV class